jgi:hypothetical protein
MSPARAMAAAAAVLVASAAGVSASGCAIPGQMLAAPSDLADYRAYRVAETPSTRLARAQAYLDDHPRGRWADEVHVAFDAEEDAWFEAAKASRSRALDYVVTLPRGPHIEAARALLVLFDQREADIDMLELLAAERRTSVRLDLAAERRRRVGEVLFEEIAALLDAATPGASLDDPPGALAAVLRGPVARTWGNAPIGLRDDRIFFDLPTPGEAQGRAAEIHLHVVLDRGRVAGGRIEGEDLFVRWTEASSVRALDASDPSDRAAAAAAVGDLLAGALEARLPAARCTVAPRAAEILTRACDGWHVSVRMGLEPGDHDLVSIRSPAIRPARPAGMR